MNYDVAAKYTRRGALLGAAGGGLMGAVAGAAHRPEPELGHTPAETRKIKQPSEKARRAYNAIRMEIFLISYISLS